MPTIASQLEEVEKEITDYEKQLETVERSLRLGSLTLVERNNLKEEELILKKEIKSHDKKRRDLQKKNLKTALLSVITLAFLVLAYIYFTSAS